MAAEISFKNIKRHDVQKIGMAYINHLVEKGDYDTAARWVFRVVRSDEVCGRHKYFRKNTFH